MGNISDSRNGSGKKSKAQAAPLSGNANSLNQMIKKDDGKEAKAVAKSERKAYNDVANASSMEDAYKSTRTKPTESKAEAPAKTAAADDGMDAYNKRNNLGKYASSSYKAKMVERDTGRKVGKLYTALPTAASKTAASKKVAAKATPMTTARVTAMPRGDGSASEAKRMANQVAGQRPKASTAKAVPVNKPTATQSTSKPVPVNKLTVTQSTPKPVPSRKMTTRERQIADAKKIAASEKMSNIKDTAKRVGKDLAAVGAMTAVTGGAGLALRGLGAVARLAYGAYKGRNVITAAETAAKMAKNTPRLTQGTAGTITPSGTATASKSANRVLRSEGKQSGKALPKPKVAASKPKLAAKTKAPKTTPKTTTKITVKTKPANRSNRDK